MLVLAFATVLEPATVRAYDLPYDPYPWCAIYSDERVARRIADF
jgi:hypothetical protein